MSRPRAASSTPPPRSAPSCRAAGVPLLLDACQSVGQMPIDVGEIGCDMLSATGRKFLRGPRGTGFLYVRRDLIETLEPPLLDLHAAEWQADGSYRSARTPAASRTGRPTTPRRSASASRSTTRSSSGLEPIRRASRARRRPARAARRTPRACTVHDHGEERCAIVTFSVAGRPPPTWSTALRRRGHQRLALTRHLQPARLRRTAGSTSLVRASVHYYNEPAELDRLVERVAVVVGS